MVYTNNGVLGCGPQELIGENNHAMCIDLGKSCSSHMTNVPFKVWWISIKSINNKSHASKFIWRGVNQFKSIKNMMHNKDVDKLNQKSVILKIEFTPYTIDVLC
jgi:hypothetical protein